jgi:glycosyltransferase involved in cell wall biosynthesis
MKKLYLVSYSFPPLGRAPGVNRAWFVKYLCDAGWSVEVVTGDRYRSLFLSGQKDETLLEVLPTEVRIHRFDSSSGWLRHDLSAIGARLTGQPTRLRKAWIDDVLTGFTPAGDGVVYAYLPPRDDAVIAEQLAKRYRLPLVLHYTDDYSEVESSTVEEADMLIAVTETIRDSLKVKYGHPNVEVIANGYATEVEVPETATVHDPIRLVYAGSFNLNTRPEYLLKAYRLLRRRDPKLAEMLAIDLYGPRGYYYNIFLRRYCDEVVRYRGYRPLNELMRCLADYDVAFASAARNISFTSKLYHYLNAGLPVLGASSSDTLRNFVNENGIGLACELDTESLAKTLGRLVEEKMNIARWREQVLKIRGSYSLEEQVKRLSALLDKLLMRRRPGVHGAINAEVPDK